VPWVRRLDRRHIALQQLVRGAVIALKRELNVFRRDRLTIMEFGSLAEHELVTEPVLGCRPRLGEARRERLAWHRLHQRVVERI
jgi:hypothetical protein